MTLRIGPALFGPLATPIFVGIEANSSSVSDTSERLRL